MARIGVDYETVKHAALKLLSQGSSPSVQRVRELLGTGSNTTIAEHLKIWREAHATREIHHLPADMPKELIAAIEVLWQTAMEQAANQLATLKNEITEQQEKLQHDQAQTEKMIADMKETIATKEQTLATLSNDKQSIQTELALTQERLVTQKQAIEKLEKQHETRLKQTTDEKHTALEQLAQCQAEGTELQKQFATQTEKQQQLQTKERERQEQSENRWLKLIDQSRQETDTVRKQFEQYQEQSRQSQKQLNQQLSNLQQRQLEQAKQTQMDTKTLEQQKRESQDLVLENEKLSKSIDKLKNELKKKKTIKSKK